MVEMVFEDWKEEYRAEGEARGLARGLAEGEARGLVEGEARKAVDAALNLLRENIAVDIISRSLGLSMEKVRELAAGLKKG